ncbi:tetratricopeptide repeat protein [Actinacidiphila bryophytorum]|uniref:Tetratricopeptide repeat protein n=1 Tax=Actinacidiphila bryophytorum TaxID=1436133 RepID=A0A9W4E4Q5_9ACTN|nr:tetratricopeptide repeat protein [Actinacidiphila bryophytorum]MBM9436357.1 hypothetical protein [Actinacidiphila bryophytorum]MBN6547156.1 hypothetical protein [Actinacidiphila bryophytorum]CAG7631349.1 conserved hypothetical protein [Actinacidiphila bryophytorum]
MEAAELERQARTLSGCIPPSTVSRLLALGHEEEVRALADEGEWFCAREWARQCGGEGRQAEALEVLAPYAATGWWPAIQAKAKLLEQWGRAAEAVTLVRPHARTGRLPLEFAARLFARHGHADEAFEILSTGLDDWFLVEALPEVATSAGREEDAADLLAALLTKDHGCEDSWCRHSTDRDSAVRALAAIRESQGRLDDAILLLNTRSSTSLNNRDQLADLLAAHNMLEELRAYAVVDGHGLAARRLAEVLEEHGDIEAAVAVCRQPDGSTARRFHGAVDLARLLVRHGRSDEAIKVMRALADEHPDDWIVHTLCTLYADHGRAAEGLAFLDALKEQWDGREEWEFFQLRLPLLALCGRRDEAIELVRAHPQRDAWYVTSALAELLAEDGRLEEAVAVLQPGRLSNAFALAGLLIDLGRIEQAVEVLQDRPRERELPASQAPWSTEPPF